MDASERMPSDHAPPGSAPSDGIAAPTELSPLTAPAPEVQAARLAHASEAARLRYELARLRDRRTVRAALALGELRRAGPAAAFAALRGQAPRLDVPGPSVLPLRPPFPHLRVVCTGDGRLLATTCVHARAVPATAATLLRRDRPDLVLIDGLHGWTQGALRELRETARERGAAVATLGADAAAAVPDADLHVFEDAPPMSGAMSGGGDGDAAVGRGAGGGQGHVLHLPPSVDVRTWSPAGLDDAAPAHRRDDAATMTVGDARRQPVVAIADVAAVGRGRCLSLLAAGAAVVTAEDAVLRDALGPAADLVVGAGEDLEARADALLADDDHRRRASVRVRRHVHAHHATWRRLAAIVAALHLDDPPRRRISVLLPTRRPDRLPQVVADLAASTHDDVQLVVLPHGDVALPDGLDGIDEVVRVAAERPLGAVLNAGLAVVDGELVAKVDDDDRYGRDHLGDQLLALDHSGADLVGRRVHGVYREDTDTTLVPAPGGEERYEDHLPGGTLLLPADTMRALRWRNVPNAVDTELVRAVHLAGGSCYSAHRYGYVRVRHGDHTYDPEVDWSGPTRAGLDVSLLDA